MPTDPGDPPARNRIDYREPYPGIVDAVRAAMPKRRLTVLNEYVTQALLEAIEKDGGTLPVQPISGSSEAPKKRGRPRKT